MAAEAVTSGIINLLRLQLAVLTCGGTRPEYMTENYQRPPHPALRPWQELAIPEAVTSVKSMIAHEEKQYLCWYASERYEGWGAIVDAGCWLGSASVALAEGLKRQQSKTKVQSFDHFRWSPGYMDEVSGAYLAAGADFLPLFLEQTSEYSEWLHPRREDLTQCRWEGGPIEFLFMDADHDWAATAAILSEFAPFLEPLRSRIVLQDFRYQGPPWYPLIFDSRPDIWEEVESVQHGHSVTFRLLQRIDKAAVSHWTQSGPSFPLVSAERLFRNRIAAGEPIHGHWFLRMLYRKYLVDGPIEQLSIVRKELMATGAVAAEELPHLENVEHLLISRGWEFYANGDFQAAASAAERCLHIGEESVYALWLLATSLFRQGKIEEAGQIIQRVLDRENSHVYARLCAAEISIAKKSYDDGRRRVLDVLAQGALGEDTIAHGINVLSRACEIDGGFLDCLIQLREPLQGSSTFWSALAREQWRIGSISEGRETMETALALSPPDELADQLREEWAGIADRKAGMVGNVAGGLRRFPIPTRSKDYQDMTLSDLTAELVFRCKQGYFGKNEESIRFGQHVEQAIGDALDIYGNRFSMERYRVKFNGIYANEDLGISMPILGATVMDLGCGSINPFGWSFLLVLLGARRAYAVDLDPVEDWGRALRALPGVAAATLLSPKQIVDQFPVDRQQILDNLAGFDFALLRAGDFRGLNQQRLEYRRDSIHSLSLPDNEIDHVASNAFFEHIPEVGKAVSELARVTRPGGIGVHVIDCTDHRRYDVAETHTLQFLTEAHVDELPYGTNRLRPHQFAELFQQAGFELLLSQEFEHVEIDSGFRAQLVEPFRSMTDEQLSAGMVRLVVRKH